MRMFFIIVIVGIFTIGCVPPAPISVEPVTFAISVTTEPEGAEVYLFDAQTKLKVQFGPSPTRIIIPADKKWQYVRIELEGYEEEIKQAKEADTLLHFELEPSLFAGIFKENRNDSLYSVEFKNAIKSLVNEAELLLSVPQNMLEYESTKWRQHYFRILDDHTNMISTALGRATQRLATSVMVYSITHASPYLANTPDDHQNSIMVSKYISSINVGLTGG